jgi:hypothetical protein
MEIKDAKPDDIPSKLRPLMAAFTASPFHVAPERKAEMERLRDKFGIRIQLKADAKDWLFEEFRIFELNRIFIGLRSLERLWAYCYAYTTITNELRKAGGTFAAIDNKAEYQLAFNLLDWASQEKLADREGEWPNFLPDPRYVDGLEHVKAANEYFLMTSGRLLLHEFAHAVLGHHTAQGTAPEVLKREEFEADAWADSWMLDKWRDYNSDEAVFIGRCMGIAFAHAPSLIFGIERQTESVSHPSPIQRIIAFIDRHLPGGNPTDKRDVDRPCAFLLLIAGHILFTKGKPFEWQPIPPTYKELFARFAPYFP